MRDQSPIVSLVKTPFELCKKTALIQKRKNAANTYAANTCGDIVDSDFASMYDYARFYILYEVWSMPCAGVISRTEEN